ncbi:hypothetical protein PhaeoP83_04268 (plasmid) [Phaeobacter inhibens]|uniref:Uncharacterized protein n=1 Tax=Phaeobacter inhibens TaxID=221822 RepID=A0ABM6RKL4_9RHOB|nr:hypothetical protein [Phaeobacter inhibens]AUQ52486.1 hypothetical protein PhaeoP83_04268 [Phaeobacter inhibens]AUQ97091.1 hypothetical protein PhaeoP66_04365 [Phaeobacter inhibens]AUR22291.1 hypothetical protein PhaeoP80_04268 [Phaeobacter inhibens]
MGLNILGGGIAAILIGAFSFYGGAYYQAASYDDLCLDLGGGRNPGDHPICVVAVDVEKALWLGPVQVTAENLTNLEVDRSTEGQSRVHLALKPAIAAAVNGFISESVGGRIEIRIGSELINTVHVAEAVISEKFTIVMTDAQAEQLALLITSGND